MNAPTPRRAAAALGGAALAASLLLAPASAFAAPAAPVATEGDSGSACTVTGGTLSWGVKERFRSYISGSIANGDWETGDGVSYEIPEFTWEKASGEIDPETGTGSVEFPGSVHFTGHDGLLDFSIDNLTLEFEGDGKASLMLDAHSTDMEGKVAVDKKQEWFADVTAPGVLAPSEDTLEIAQMPAVLTNSGAAAFAGFYQADEELDPITVNLTFDGCDASGAPVLPPATADTQEQGADPADAAAETRTPAAEEARIPWLPIGIGAAALLVIGVTTGMLIGGRKPKAAPQADAPGAPETPGTTETSAE